MAPEVLEAPTEDEVFEHFRSIPTRYQRCAAGDHNWDMTQATPYNSSGNRYRGQDITKAAWLDCADTCVPDNDGERGCSRKRSYQMEYDSRRQGFVRTTEYTYAQRHPDLVSPKGISLTGINARSEMPDVRRDRSIRQQMLRIAAKGAA